MRIGRMVRMLWRQRAMGAYAVDAHRQIAVSTQHTIPRRKTVSTQPAQYLGAAFNALAAVLSAVSVDMVDGQELFTSFAATSTGTAIMGQDGIPEPVTARFTPDPYFGLLRAFMHVCGVLAMVGAEFKSWFSRSSAARADSCCQITVSSALLLFVVSHCHNYTYARSSSKNWICG